jgi:hypothetical protein
MCLGRPAVKIWILHHLLMVTQGMATNGDSGENLANADGNGLPIGIYVTGANQLGKVNHPTPKGGGL